MWKKINKKDFNEIQQKAASLDKKGIIITFFIVAKNGIKYIGYPVNDIQEGFIFICDNGNHILKLKDILVVWISDF